MVQCCVKGFVMDYISVEEAAQKWGISIRSVQLHCQKGNVQGVVLSGKA